MKKTIPQKNENISPEEALNFLEGMRQLMEQKDLPTTPISIRIPANLLNLLKSKAKIEKKKYQSLIIEYIREGLTHPTK
ncbi:MAG: hypothetical protein M9899_10030 [Bdellovibrionaceae bacterium]|nr:hypothetical protein [Pseudobdellovibrionaceae bacterium]